ncbi:uncharacterized protein [Solanum tuberosum]|uniref:uncharacterized protein n=2 Tax=Solanum tuberosum TaxID=4113 RepID=UPI00073A0462|nr:PREDICTED: uncharacterized protein LOC102578984 [Solanum tuberosum]
MHIEKNVFDNIFWTLLNVDGKGKDNLKSRLDLQEMRIRKALHPKKKANGKYYLPPACFTLSNKQKDMLLQVLKDVKVPDGYSSNISNCVDLKQRTMHGLKSHDCHVLMQQLLPIALRNLVPVNVLKPLIELSNFFRGISSTVMKIGELEKLQDRVAITLCHLERIFPPSFFDIMEHLVIHLSEEAMLGGPSQYRTMWAIERFLLSLKNFVRSRSHPEGCIAEGQWIQEIMTFCSRYLDDVETKSNRPLRNNTLSNETMDLEGRRSSKEKGFILDDITHAQEHKHVLFNAASTTPYREEHIKEIKKGNPRLSRHDVDRIHNEKFQIWFRNHVEKMHLAGEQIPQDIQHLAVGPSKQAKRMTGYICNGVRYLTKSRDAKRKTQNSGIMVKATTQSYASARDKNPILADVSFYGILTDIIELYYTKKFKFVLFTCKWVNNNKGLIEKDDYGFTLVNFNHLLYTKQHLSNEPFIFASQAQQVFYVDHPMENEWQIVVKFKPRGFYDLGEDTPSIEHKEGHMELWPEQQLDDTTFESEDDIEWVRHGVPGIEIDPQTLECNEAFDEDDDTS